MSGNDLIPLEGNVCAVEARWKRLMLKLNPLQIDSGSAGQAKETPRELLQLMK